MALSTAGRRAIAIRKSIARKAQPVAANENGATTKAANDTMHPRLLAMCVDAGGFDQNARFA